MTPIRFFLDKGHLTNRGADTLGLTGVGILWVTAYLFDEWSGFWFWFFLLLGGALGYIGAYGGLAKRFGFYAPFSNDPLGWRTAKRSCDEPKSSKDKGGD